MILANARLAPSEASSAFPHYSYLDALRGWAILLVILNHSASGHAVIDTTRGNALIGPTLNLHPAVAAICWNAQDGVMLFFVISALSLTLSLNAKRAFSLADYAKRRFFRIAPMFYLGIALYTWIGGFGPRGPGVSEVSGVDILATFAFVHTWTLNAYNSVVPGDWSIGIEMNFYLLLPILLWLTRNDPMRCLILSLGLFALKIVEALLIGGETFVRLREFSSYLIVFSIGIGLASILKNRPPFRMPGFAGLALMAFTTVGLPLLGVRNAILYNAIGFAGVAYATHWRDNALLTNRALIVIGKLSFSLYILHFAMLIPSFWLISHLTNDRGEIFLALYMPTVVAMTCAVGGLSYRWIEKPFIDFAHRTLPRLGSPDDLFEIVR